MKRVKQPTDVLDRIEADHEKRSRDLARILSAQAFVPRGLRFRRALRKIRWR